MITNMNIVQYGAGVFTIADFLNPVECAQYIAMSERTGFKESEIITAAGSEVFKGIRNNDRVIFDDPALAALLFTRAQPYLPKQLDDWRLLGINERLRFYRYGPDEYFKWHKDGPYIRHHGEESRLTLMIYLNDDFTGGSTEFKSVTITPQQGMLLVFPHHYLHQGATVESGRKYVLRTDVMYRQHAIKPY